MFKFRILSSYQTSCISSVGMIVIVIADVDLLTATDDWKIYAVDDNIPVEEDSAAQMVDDYW